MRPWRAVAKDAMTAQSGRGLKAMVPLVKVILDVCDLGRQRAACFATKRGAKKRTSLFFSKAKGLVDLASFVYIYDTVFYKWCAKVKRKRKNR